MNNKYSLRYLPIFESDLYSAAEYISNTLINRQAADNLINETEKAILKRLENPLSFEPYSSFKDRKHKYYRIIVKNYSVFYVVIDNVMEVRRFIYNGRDISKFI